MTWQPIETAPKDGTWILGFIPRSVYEADCPSALVVSWWEYQIEASYEPAAVHGLYRKVEHRPYGAWQDDDGDPCLPTHWMPLPEPPTPTRAGGADG